MSNDSNLPEKDRNFFGKWNVPRTICKHLIGEEHKHEHHMIVGILIMTAGITVVKISLLVPFTPVHIAGDLVGYAVHGIGLTPFVESVIRNANENSES